ncbi:hypothetical protein AMS68_003928 [Peltaster fructicola]|uniref:FUN14 domain-containing protein n=1 Tax=Peltaster fructicola TaxID=286661 RepID=A0A6H0XUR3_9PEZI|nr:hypothetical protein AMS68_003928 [Peltaster fructicola]
MASRLFQSSLYSLRTPLLAAGLGVSATVCLRQQLGLRRSLLLDASSPLSQLSSAFHTYEAKNDAPLLKNGRLNGKAVRQISTGSVLGVLAGLGVSTFSKPLAILLGLFIAGVQTAASYGYHIVPYNSIQRYVKGIDIKGALQENVPLKISFGLLFALTGFGAFSSDV